MNLTLSQGFKGQPRSSREEEIQPLAVVRSSFLLTSALKHQPQRDYSNISLFNSDFLLYSMLCGCFLQDVGKSLTC